MNVSFMEMKLKQEINKQFISLSLANQLNVKMSFLTLGLVFLQALSVTAHGDHAAGGHDQTVAADADWATRHMAGATIMYMTTARAIY